MPDSLWIFDFAGRMAESGKETLMRQNRHGLEAADVTDADKEVSLKLIGRLFDTMESQGRQGYIDTH